MTECCIVGSPTVVAGYPALFRLAPSLDLNRTVARLSNTPPIINTKPTSQHLLPNTFPLQTTRLSASDDSAEPCHCSDLVQRVVKGM